MKAAGAAKNAAANSTKTVEPHERLCTSCKSSLLYPHPEAYKPKFQFYVKCSICGFTVERRPQNLPFPSNRP